MDLCLHIILFQIPERRQFPGQDSIYERADSRSCHRKSQDDARILFLRSVKPLSSLGVKLRLIHIIIMRAVLGRDRLARHFAVRSHITADLV